MDQLPKRRFFIHKRQLNLSLEYIPLVLSHFLHISHPVRQSQLQLTSLVDSNLIKQENDKEKYDRKRAISCELNKAFFASLQKLQEKVKLKSDLSQNELIDLQAKFELLESCQQKRREALIVKQSQPKQSTCVRRILLVQAKEELQDLQTERAFCQVVEDSSSDSDGESRAIPFAGHVHTAARNVLLNKMINKKQNHVYTELQLIEDTYTESVSNSSDDKDSLDDVDLSDLWLLFI